MQAEKQELMKTKNKQGELNIEIEEHRGEITNLNQRYTSALKDKVSVYVELVNSVKELKKRHQKFFSNELQLVQLQNQCKTLKKELEQKKNFRQRQEAKINNQKLSLRKALAIKGNEEEKKRVEGSRKKMIRDMVRAADKLRVSSAFENCIDNDSIVLYFLIGFD